MMQQKNSKNYLGVVLLAGLIPVTLLLGNYYHLSLSLILVAVILESLLWASSTLWAYANKHATGSDWWQDDDASGWRGY